MSEVAADPPSPPPADTKIAGKYDTPEAFDKGFREISTKLGLELDANTPLVAKDGKGLYASQEAAVSVFKGFEKMMATKGQQPAAVSPNSPPPKGDELQVKPATSDNGSGPKNLGDWLGRAGVNGEELAAHFEEHGELNEDHYRRLVQQRPTKEVINEIMGLMREVGGYRQTAAQSIVASAAEAVGGQTKHDAIRDWAAKGGIPEAELNRLGAMVDPKRGGSIENYPDYIQILASRHAKAIGANGSKPLITGQPGPTSNGLPTTREEFAKLMGRVNNGDPDALETLQKMSRSEISKFQG